MKYKAIAQRANSIQKQIKSLKDKHFSLFVTQFPKGSMTEIFINSQAVEVFVEKIYKQDDKIIIQSREVESGKPHRSYHTDLVLFDLER